MTLLMRDSTNPGAIPTDTPVVAGYVDGIYSWGPNDWARFPNSVKLTIACFSGTQADILDIETGCSSSLEAPGWCDRFNRPGRRAPTLYVNRSNWPQVRTAVGGRTVDYWVSTLDGTQQVPGAVAVQYIDTGAYDESTINDPLWIGGAMDETTFKKWVRDVLNEGTAAGQLSWAGTEKDTHDKVGQALTDLGQIQATCAQILAAVQVGDTLTPTQAQQLQDISAKLAAVFK